MVPDDYAEEERAVDRFWDHVAQGRPDANGGLDPADAATIQYLHAFDDRSGPTRAFVQRLREDLMHTHAIPVSSDPSPRWWPRERGAQPLHPAIPRTPARGGHQRWSLTRLAAVLVVLVTLGVGAFALGTGRWTAPDQRTMIPAVIAPATPSPDGVTEQTLVTVTLPANVLPRGAGVGAGLAHFTIPPGTRSTWTPPSCCPGPVMEYVLSGSYTVQAQAAIRVIRTDGPVEEIPAGTEVTLAAGDALVSRNEIVVEGANSGAASVELLSWVLVDDPSERSSGHLLAGWITHAYDVRSGDAGSYGIRVPTGPATVRLQRIDLAPGAAFPPSAEGTRFAVTLPENAAGTPRAGLIGRMSDNTMVNTGQAETLTVYVLTLEPTSGGSGTPGASSPTP